MMQSNESTPYQILEQEIAEGRLPKNLLPLQSGVGSVANAVISGLAKGPFTDLSIYTEVIQDGMFDLIDAGKVTVCSGTALSPSPDGLKRFYANIDEYRKNHSSPTRNFQQPWYCSPYWCHCHEYRYRI